MTHRLAALALALLFVRPFSAAADPKSPFAAVPEQITELSRLTGLKPLRKVEYAAMSRDELKAFLEKRVKEELNPADIRMEELVLKRMGLVPRDFQLARTMIDLMAEQAEAFYDYRQKKLFLVDVGDDSPMQQAALFHELAHALADQHFEVEKFIKRGKTDDGSLARAAVLEGQATWLMYEWMASKAGQSLRSSPALASMLSSRTDFGAQYPQLTAAPLYVRSSLLFPYIQGLRFQQAVVEKLGTAAFSEVFRRPPANSQHILHPDKYFAKASAASVKLPRMADSGRYKDMTEVSVGEFDHAVLIEQYASREESDSLAPHWRGGLLKLLEDRQQGKVVMLYASEWDTPEHARRMFAAWKLALAGKCKQVTYVKETDDLLEGTSTDGGFQVRLDGTRLTAIEGVWSLAETASAR
jgi:hypothetical protein